MRHVVTAVFAVALVLGAGSSAQAGFWSDVKQGARETKQEIKQGFKSGAREVKEDTREARNEVRSKSKEGWKEVKEGTKSTASETKSGLKKAWKELTD